MILLLLAACGTLVDVKSDDTGTLEAGADPYACVESERIELTDLSVPADGLDFAPQAVVDAYGGAWTGTFSFTAGNEERAGFGVRPEGLWQLVKREASGSGLGDGAPVEDCGPMYSWGTESVLTDASGALDEVFGAGVIVRALDAVELFGVVPLGAVVGSTRPSGWDPADWDRTDLVVTGTASPAGWLVSAMWVASQEADAKDEGTAETGTVDVSGMTEGVGSGSFTPAEE